MGLWQLIKAYTTGNSEYGDGRPEFIKNMFKETSVPLDDGGDTHLHPWKDDNGVTVTTRLDSDYGGFTDHTNIRDRDSDAPSQGEFNPSEESGQAFRSVFGDDN